MPEVLGPRDAVIGRELTKRFEEIRRGPLAELAASLAADGGERRVRGEIVVAVAGKPHDGAAALAAGAPDLDALLRRGLDAGEPLSEVARAAAERLGIPRRAAYQRALELRPARQARCRPSVATLSPAEPRRRPRARRPA